MKPQPNFFLINRALLDHPWLKKNRDCQLAWIYIVGRANYDTGQINLTEVYREVSDMFENYQWRRFIKRCVVEGMLGDVVTANRGASAGYEQIAFITNYSKYQGEKSSKKVPEPVPEQLHEYVPEQTNAQHANNVSFAGAGAGAMPEPVPESYKEYSKEEKEEKEEEGPDSYISSEEAAFAEMSGKPNPKTEELKNQTHLRRLIGGENFKHPQVKESWRSWYLALSPGEIEAIWKASRQQSDTTPLFWFVDVCNGRRAKPKLGGEGKGSAPPKIRFGDVVSHPVEGEFVADFEALYQDAWRCPEGHFIPASELRVVRSTDA